MIDQGILENNKIFMSWDGDESVCGPEAWRNENCNNTTKFKI